MEVLYRLSIKLCRLLDWISWLIFLLYSILPKNRLPPMLDADILNQSATTLARKIRTREITSEEVVRVFIKRCEKVNPLINAIVEDRFAEAIIEAKAIDQDLRTTKKTNDKIEEDTPLLGVPVTIKESCALVGMSFSIGSKARVGLRAEKDGAAVSALKKAGAIPIAVTNTPEFCISYETYNYVTGYTRNPYDLHRAAGGSSGGEAALISSGGSVIGLASDFGGSIRIPSLFTGLFGHKPTPGIISPVGHFPYVTSAEFLKYFSMGIITRYAEDLNLTMKILAGEKARDLGLEKEVNIKEVNIYYIQQGISSIPMSIDIQNAIENAATYLYKQRGCSVQKATVAEFEESFEICMGIVPVCDGIKSNLQYASSKDSNLFMEVIKSFFKVSDLTLDYTFLRFLIMANGFMSQKRRKLYLETKNSLHKKLMEMLKDNGVLFFPTFPSSAFYKRQRITKSVGCFYSVIFNILGFPATHVPVGLNHHKLPIGFQVVAAPNQDRLCLAVAKELEIAFGGWVAPPECK